MRVSSFLLAVLLLALLVDAARAGPNEGGTLILHGAPYLGRAPEDPCGQDAGILTCGEAVTEGFPLFQTVVWTVFGAFPEESSPRVKGVTFGVDYDVVSIYPSDYAACGDFELPNPGWPDPGTGSAVTWGTTQTDRLLRVYSFIGYAYYDTQVCLTPHPGQGGYFADDSIPAELDLVLDYGCLGFGTEPGYLPCPGATPASQSTWGAIKDAFR